MLRPQLLHNRLDDQIGSAHRGRQVDGVAEPPDGFRIEALRGARIVAMASLRLLAQVTFDVGAGALGGHLGHFDDGGQEAVGGGDFGDAGAHEAAADDGHVADAECRSVGHGWKSYDFLVTVCAECR